MALKVGSALIGVKPEGTAYTFDVPTAADCFPAYDISVTPEGEEFDNPETTGNFGKAAGSPGPASMEISFKTLLHGQGGSAVGVPHMVDALKGAGCKAVFTPDTTTPTSIGFKPINTFDEGTGSTGTVSEYEHPAEAYSCIALIDGTQYAVKGAMSDLTLTWTLGQPIEAAFNFKGAYVDRVDSALLTPTGVSSEVAPMFIGASSFSIHGYAAVVEAFSISLGNVLAPLKDAKDTNGILGYTISDRRVTGTATLQDELVDTEDFYGAWRDGSEASLTSGALGDQYNRINFLASLIQYLAPSPSDRDKVAILEMPFRVNIAGGGAEGSDFVLTFD